MNSERFSQLAMDMAKVLDDKKGEDILLIDVREVTILADTFLICSGRSTPHVKMLADELEQAMARAGHVRRRIEGYAEGRWIVMDFGDVLVHIFHKEEREYYSIERLWGSGENEYRFVSTPEGAQE